MRQNYITIAFEECSARKNASVTEMSIQDLKANDGSADGSTTYIEFQSDGSDAAQEAYNLVRRGGSIREGVEDVNELYAQLTPLIADVLFDGDATGMMEWLDLDADDWEAYNDE
ncbi:hypothetical protein [Halobacterium zhouii]|uniref:hypothetical protein n=1 Tax=Halobacterium zhouii TaxID=2902624 RepID=UPI001E3CBCE8|nr:hypothetical protein [Halobacterium zhouii]